ncbi:MAG: class C sortase [Oscillospiraceae bacterium]|nr:class C sortase [Oscillospiraceae bacterium]
MKNILINLLILLIFLAGLCLMLYPTISNIVNERNMTTVITRYEEDIDLMAEEERSAMLEEARAYNDSFVDRFVNAQPGEIAASAEYNQTLDVTGNGIMGSIQISKIRVNLPIYHGTSDSVLQVAVGHLPETSLPVGGKTSHAVLSAHTGLPSARLFTDLDQLKIGDLFSITVLGEVLVYEVDQILVVEPHDSAELRIHEGEDYVTLVTCTPYGINSHRLLVRGKRIFLTEEEAQDYSVENDAVFLEKTLLVPFAVVPILLGYFAWELLRPAPKRRKTDREANEQSE